MPKERKDFDYQYLCKSIEDISRICESLRTKKIVVIISTVLPGTLQQYVIPKLSKYVKLCYNPYFIAMGTVLKDFFQPEFVLLGCNDQVVVQTMKDFYSTISPAHVFTTTIETAELIKVCYNTMISTKIAFANTVMEMCDKIPNTNVDHVTKALQMATSRICSGAYLTGGMGDGGGCHPRDNIAMSWLSNQLGLRYNLFDAIMTAREEQTEYLADLIEKYHSAHYTYPIVILGKAFKPNTNLIAGSPSVLLYNLLQERGIVCSMYDPHVDATIKDAIWERVPSIVFIGTKHNEFMDYTFADGSIIIDPHRYIRYNTKMKTLHYVGDPIHSVNMML
jgi:UDPglucose 6-dehydrogenase